MPPREVKVLDDTPSTASGELVVMKLSLIITGLLSAAVMVIGQATTQTTTGTIVEGPFPDDLNGSNFTYPFPLKLFRFSSQLQKNLEMAFMNVPPSEGTSNGTKTAIKTALLLHGKNFCGATWENTIRALTRSGYRVIAPDQIGFCKSSKPASYQFSLHQLSLNTRRLLDTLDIPPGKVTIIGHSLGGMLATRFSLQYPSRVDRLVLVNSIGLEDYLAKGVPYIDIDEHYASEARSSYESIRGYEQAVYYLGEWKEEYDKWVRMLVNIYYGSRREEFVQGQARIVDMVLTQPVANSFRDLKPRTLLIMGEKDRTAIGAQWAPKEVAGTLGRYDQLGPDVKKMLKDGDLIRFPDYGHAPHISNPEEFHDKLIGWLVG